MKVLGIAPSLAFLILVGCGGSSNAPPTNGTPMAMISAGPLTTATENIAPTTVTTTAPLPSIDGIYGGQIVLPPGSGTATLTFSINPPAGVTALTELTPEPQIAYITITAQSPFTLASSPGFNLTVPSSYTTIDMWLNSYGGTGWSRGPIASSNPTSVNAMVCFPAAGASIALEQGQSLYLAINGDDVLPTPPTTGTPSPCPQG